MNLQEAIKYKNNKLLNGQKSDGCTFVPDFIFKKACQVHDMLIRFKRVSRKEADDLYLEYMLKLSNGRKRYNFVAYTYYYAMRYVAKFFGGDFVLAIAAHGFVTIITLLAYLG